MHPNTQISSMRRLPHYWPFVGGIHILHKGRVMQNFDVDVIFAASRNELLNNQSDCWWFEMPKRSYGVNVT